MENIYEQGQLDLIKKIKKDVLNIIETSSQDDMMFNVLELLKGLEPIKGTTIWQQ